MGGKSYIQDTINKLYYYYTHKYHKFNLNIDLIQAQLIIGQECYYLSSPF